MIEQPTSAEFLNQTGRALLEAAHMASDDGYDAIAHVEGIVLLHVREVKSIAAQANIAMVHCWSSGESEAETWLIPFAAVRAVEIKGRWAERN